VWTIAALPGVENPVKPRWGGNLRGRPQGQGGGESENPRRHMGTLRAGKSTVRKQLKVETRRDVIREGTLSPSP